MTGLLQVTLPHGLWHNGRLHGQAWTRPLSGEDEAFLLETGSALSPARRVSALLARCVARLGPLCPVSEEAAGRLGTLLKVYGGAKDGEGG